ncbi:LLM class flavin-dependent oxidoreductase [Actinokineospora sp. 24-640]
MRVGIVILPERRWAENRRRWQAAEEYGFDHAWTYDHLGWGPLLDGPWFDAATTLAAAAGVTSTIRLGTFVSSPNFRHPVSYARQVISLDDVSDGRLTLGLGSGGGGHDRTVFGVPDLSLADRLGRFGEFADLLDRLLTEEKVDFDGEFYRAVDARNTPGCAQRPRVPFLVAANGPRAMRVAARHGQAWLTGPIAAEVRGRLSTEVDGWWRDVARLVEQFDEALAAEGRPAASVERHITLDGSPLLSMSSVDAFVHHVGKARELGFTDAITHWPRPEGIYQADEAVLEAVASDVLPMLKAR